MSWIAEEKGNGDLTKLNNREGAICISCELNQGRKLTEMESAQRAVTAWKSTDWEGIQVSRLRTERQ